LGEADVVLFFVRHSEGRGGREGGREGGRKGNELGEADVILSFVGYPVSEGGREGGREGDECVKPPLEATRSSAFF
jgi:hypothetical protein